jgi:hypothetical protein
MIKNAQSVLNEIFAGPKKCEQKESINKKSANSKVIYFPRKPWESRQ